VVAGIWPIGVVLALGSSLALVRRLPDVPAGSAVSIALRGHVLAGQQVAAAARREWWPIVLAGAMVSRRWRWSALIAVLVAGRRTPTDVAYGWGVWSSMRRLRTWAPVVPRLSAWPGRQTRQAGWPGRQTRQA
jgi:hypothetical protein